MKNLRAEITLAGSYCDGRAGGNVKYNSLLKIIQALGVTPAEFFSEGFD